MSHTPPSTLDNKGHCLSRVLWSIDVGILLLMLTCTFVHRSAESDQKDPDAPNQPVSRVHVDYTVKSGPERLQAVLPDEAHKLMKTPFAVIQVSRATLAGCQLQSHIVSKSSMTDEDAPPKPRKPCHACRYVNKKFGCSVWFGTHHVKGRLHLHGSQRSVQLQFCGKSRMLLKPDLATQVLGNNVFQQASN